MFRFKRIYCPILSISVFLLLVIAHFAFGRSGVVQSDGKNNYVGTNFTIKGNLEVQGSGGVDVSGDGLTLQNDETITNTVDGRVDVAGNLVVVGSITATTILASTGTNVSGVSYLGGRTTVNNVLVSTGLSVSGVGTVTGNLNAGQFVGSGAGLTSIPAASISAGSLGSGVIGSSHAIDSITPGAISSNTYNKLFLPAENIESGTFRRQNGSAITNITAANIDSGIIGAAVIVSSVAGQAVGTQQINTSAPLTIGTGTVVSGTFSADNDAIVIKGGNLSSNGVNYFNSTTYQKGPLMAFQSGETAYAITHMLNSQFIWYMYSTGNRSMVLGDIAGYNQNYDHGLQTNPTLFIHSGVAPNTDNSQWLGLTHNQTNATITTGLGSLSIATHTLITGNVGIGITNPTSDLHVAGNSIITGSMTIQGSDGPVTISTGAHISGILTADNSNLVAKGGRVGIGTTNPGANLDVVGTFQAQDLATLLQGIKMASRSTAQIIASTSAVGTAFWDTDLSGIAVATGTAAGNFGIIKVAVYQ